MTIDEIQAAFRFEMDMILFDPFSGESESEEWYLERNKRNDNDMNVICYRAKKEAIELLEELKDIKSRGVGYTKEDIQLNRQASYNKAIDNVLVITKEYKNHFIADNLYKEFFDEVEQLKDGVKE